MFKRFSKLKQAIIVLAVTLASAVAVACSAPDPTGGGGDLNKDFVAYRHKIISILRDNGMRVNDVEGKSAAMSAKSARPSAFSDRKSDIADAVISDPNKTDSMDSILLQSEFRRTIRKRDVCCCVRRF